MLRIDTLGKCRRRSALYARTPEKGASRKPINRQLHKTRFAEAGGVALGYLDTRYRPQHLVGVHKIHPRASRLRRLHTAYYALASISFTLGKELAPRDGGQVCLVGPFRGARVSEGPRGETGCSERDRVTCVLPHRFSGVSPPAPARSAPLARYRSAGRGNVAQVV